MSYAHSQPEKTDVIPWNPIPYVTLQKSYFGALVLLGRGSFARAPLSVILFDQIGPGINSRRKIYGSTSLHFAQLMRLQQEDLTKTHVDQCNQDARIQPNINAFIDLPGVFMLYTPSPSFLVLAKAFFRGSSEQYGFLIKVTPPSIMGSQRNLSLNDSVCPFLLLFPLLPFLFFLSPYPVPGALLGVAMLEVPHLRSLRLLLQEPEPKKETALFPPLPCKRTLFFSFSFFKSCFYS
ncbi:hypothetical protein VNO77_34604 [Canavalia gladiata]|uniref:Uncharacterized protein n=1 Tax=Canavalia gladiata TaxID=3824 RepID=A0AAN9KEJ1_CANGL